MDDSEFLTVDEIAKRLRLSKMTIYRLIHAGELEAIRVGRSYRVGSESFESYIGKVKEHGSSRAGEG